MRPVIGEMWDGLCFWVDKIGVIYLSLPWITLFAFFAFISWVRYGEWDYEKPDIPAL